MIKRFHSIFYSYSYVFCTVAVLDIIWGKEKASIIIGSNFSSLRWSDLAGSLGFVIKPKQKIQLVSERVISQ